MPELPELEGLAERLGDALDGRTLERADVLHFSALKTVSPPIDALPGRKVEGTGRRGKYVSFALGDLEIVLHLGQGGRVEIEDPPRRTKPRGALVRLVFSGALALLVREHGTERKAAWWVLPSGAAGPREHLGPEPFDDEAARYLRGAPDKRQLHTILRDQRTIAGIGRGFADDILHRARLSPLSTLASLDETERERLIAAMHDVLRDALDRERERSGGLAGKLGDRFAVHGRYGAPCPTCGTTLERVSYESREVVYCPACQTGGKKLADRRLSRLLR
ncbi:MAG TPA: DNA-formamidopyrimidine glycosylase family protein [Actinomycetota bacterium]|jgi:formamidopyrimidine-DNA glycosylase|nr:DNA-formamidopyrimidine glycosylase family protein [Actinomycetota bacterium]